MTINSVTSEGSDQIRDGAITENKIAAKAVKAEHFADGAVGTAAAADLIVAKGDLIVGTAVDTAAILSVGANGTVPVASSGQTKGVEYARVASGGITPAQRANTGIIAATFEPDLATTTFTMTDNSLRLFAIDVPYKATLTGIGWCQTTQGDTTADNENRVGLYTSDGTNLTLVASCADDGTLWEQAAGIVRKAFSAPYAANAGRYWIGILANWSAVATAPVIAGRTGPASTALSAPYMTDSDEQLVGNLASNTLAASVAWSGSSVSSARPWLFVY